VIAAVGITVAILNLLEERKKDLPAGRQV